MQKNLTGKGRIMKENGLKEAREELEELKTRHNNVKSFICSELYKKLDKQYQTLLIKQEIAYFHLIDALENKEQYLKEKEE